MVIRFGDVFGIELIKEKVYSEHTVCFVIIFFGNLWNYDSIGNFVKRIMVHTIPFTIHRIPFSTFV